MFIERLIDDEYEWNSYLADKKWKEPVASATKKIKDLTMQEMHDICAKQSVCNTCPLMVDGNCTVLLVNSSKYRWDAYKDIEIDVSGTPKGQPKKLCPTKRSIYK